MTITSKRFGFPLISPWYSAKAWLNSLSPGFPNPRPPCSWQNNLISLSTKPRIHVLCQTSSHVEFFRLADEILIGFRVSGTPTMPRLRFPRSPPTLLSARWVFHRRFSNPYFDWFVVELPCRSFALPHQVIFRLARLPPEAHLLKCVSPLLPEHVHEYGWVGLGPLIAMIWPMCYGGQIYSLSSSTRWANIS